MMDKKLYWERNNKKRAEQLGMPFPTAQNRLKKKLMFLLIEKCDLNTCYRCNELILSADFLSVDHKKPWFNVDASLFWDLGNIAFSHLSCNIKDGRRKKGTKSKHGNETRYAYGCRCVKCRQAHTSYQKALREK